MDKLLAYYVTSRYVGFREEGNRQMTNERTRRTIETAIVRTNDGKLYQVKEDGEFWSSREVRSTRQGFIFTARSRWELMSKYARGATIISPFTHW